MLISHFLKWLTIKLGSLIPYIPRSELPIFGSAQNPPPALGIMVFPGKNSSKVSFHAYGRHNQNQKGYVYEDAGDTIGYLNGEHSRTEFSLERISEKNLRLQVFPSSGSFPGMFKEISYEIKFMGVWPPYSLLVNDEYVPYGGTK
jgi:hypothetical protein